MKKYATEEERKAAHREAVKRWKENNPEKYRAHQLINNYKQEDKKYNRGEGDLTAQWIVDNIFTKKCAHCEKTGWDVIGCNRIDNSKPHTIDNVEPCCEDCNHKLATKHQRKIFGKKIIQINPKTNEIINIWESQRQAAEQLGFNYSHIRQCCDGGYFDNRRNKWVNVNAYKGFKWEYLQ